MEKISKINPFLYLIGLLGVLTQYAGERIAKRPMEMPSLEKVGRKVYTIVSNNGFAEVRSHADGTVLRYPQFRRYTMKIDLDGNITLEDIGLGMRGNTTIIDKIMSAGCFRVDIDYKDNDTVYHKTFDCEALSRLGYFFGDKVPWSTSGQMIVTVTL